VKYRVAVANRSFEIEIEHGGLVRVNGCPLYVDLEQVGGLPVYALVLDDEGYVVFVEEGQEEYRVEIQGQVYPVTVHNQRPQLAPPAAHCAGDEDNCLAVAAPLPGHLISLLVGEGDRVQPGQVVAVVESMKMKMELKAPRAGLVDMVNGPAPRDVSSGEELVILATT
jgi:biotin carboxyl carrier protein